jgi:hypothetical protein
MLKRISAKRQSGREEEPSNKERFGDGKGVSNDCCNGLCDIFEIFSRADEGFVSKYSNANTSVSVTSKRYLSHATNSFLLRKW